MTSLFQPEPYSYAYEVKDAPTGNDYSSQANSDGKRVTGEYRVLLPDGRRQVPKQKRPERWLRTITKSMSSSRERLPSKRASETLKEAQKSPEKVSSKTRTIDLFELAFTPEQFPRKRLTRTLKSIPGGSYIQSLVTLWTTARAVKSLFGVISDQVTSFHSHSTENSVQTENDGDWPSPYLTAPKQ